MTLALLTPRRSALLLAFLLAGAAMPAAASGPPPAAAARPDAGPGPGSGPKPEAVESPRPDSPPDWSGAQAGDFVEYSISVGYMAGPSATLRLEVLSADDKEVRVAVSLSPPPPLFARGLLFAIRRTAPEPDEPESPRETFFGKELKPGRERVFLGGDDSIVCQKFGGDVESSHASPISSGCAAPGNRSLYLGGSIVRYETSMRTLQGQGYSYKLELQAVGRASPSSQEVPPLAFREGSGYERFSRDPYDVRLERHTFRTSNGSVLDETIQWTKEEGAKPQRDDRVFEGIRLTRVDYTFQQPLLEYVWQLIWLAMHEPYPEEGRPAKATPVTVGGRSVPGWKLRDAWKNDAQEGKQEAVFAWDPWALKDAPVQVRFLPFTSKLSTWSPDNRKQVETEESRTLRWY